MQLFKKEPPATDIPGRRRPTADNGRAPAPNPAFSYYSQRSQHSENVGRLDSAGAADRDRPPSASFAGRHRTMASVAGIAVVIMVCASLVLSPEPRIILLEDKATAYFLQDPSIYRESAKQELGKSIFNRNKLTVDTASLRLGLLQSYPEIRNVSVSMPLVGTRPNVFIEPYKPSFILTTTDGNAYLLDATGRALATTNQITDIDSLDAAIVQDKSGIPVKLGSRAIPSTTVRFIETVVAGLESKDLAVTSLVLPAASYQLDVSISGTKHFVKFNLEGDALQQAGTYLATRQRLAQDRITPAEYVDVRVPERAYYK